MCPKLTPSSSSYLFRMVTLSMSRLSLRLTKVSCE
jgi:hypothetical protein